MPDLDADYFVASLTWVSARISFLDATENRPCNSSSISSPLATDSSNRSQRETPPMRRATACALSPTERDVEPPSRSDRRRTAPPLPVRETARRIADEPI